MDNEVLTVLKDIQDKVNTILLQVQSEKKPILTLSQFCEFIRMSPYKFQQFYDLHRYELALTEPRTKDGNQPRYSFSDITYLINFIKEKEHKL